VDAASVASLMCTSEAMIVDLPQKDSGGPAPPMGGPPGGGMPGMF